MTARANAAARLLERLRWLDEQRANAAWATVAVDQAFGLIDSAGPYVVLDALLVAAAAPPPDPAAVVGVDEILALVAVYATGCTDWGRAYERGGPAACDDIERRLEAAHRDLRAAIERLCKAAPAYELGGGRSS